MSLAESKIISTKQRLGNAIREFDPELTDLINLAESGYYDDFESPLATPSTLLIDHLRKVGAHDLAQRVMEGEFDGTEEEGQAWFEREGKFLFPEDT